MAVTAAADHRVVDRRRIELVEPGVPAAPIHHQGKPLADDGVAALVARVRASAARATSASLDALAAAVPEPIVSLSLRAWPPRFPNDIAVVRRAPYEARARGWAVHVHDALTVEREAAGVLVARADEVLHGPRAALGPPRAKDHRTALAATVLASATGTAG